MSSLVGGNCSVCREKITSAVLSAAGKQYHSDCYMCVECLMPFPGGNHYEHGGRLYCQHDYETHFGHRCGRCGNSIVGRFVNALDLKWHPEHFTCEACGTGLAGTSFVKRMGRPYCKPCVTALKEQELEFNRSLCESCRKPILDRKDMIVFRHQKYHASHFTCSNPSCRVNLTSECMEIDGKLFCVPCHGKQLQATCAACHKPIEGRSITALGKQFHPEVRFLTFAALF